MWFWDELLQLRHYLGIFFIVFDVLGYLFIFIYTRKIKWLFWNIRCLTRYKKMFFFLSTLKQIKYNYYKVHFLEL